MRHMNNENHCTSILAEEWEVLKGVLEFAMQRYAVREQEAYILFT